MTETSSKRCVLCGEDRTGLPRVKDPKGRYYCPECYNQAIQQKPAKSHDTPLQAPLSIDPNDDTSAETAVDEPVESLALHDSSLLNDLVAEVTSPSQKQQLGPCENCGQPLPVNDMLCTACGYNRHTGEILTIHTAKRKADWAADSGMFVTPGVAGGGVMLLLGILFFIGRTVEPVALAFFITHFVFALGVTLAVLFYAFRESFGQGLLSMFVPFYILWFVYGVHKGPYLKWLYGAMLVGSALFGALVAILGINALPGDFWDDLQLQ